MCDELVFLPTKLENHKPQIIYDSTGLWVNFLNVYSDDIVNLLKQSFKPNHQIFDLENKSFPSKFK